MNHARPQAAAYGMIGAGSAEGMFDTRAAQQHYSTLRGDLLRQAAKLTEGDRNERYGDPAVNLGLQGELTAPFLLVLEANPRFCNLSPALRAALRGAMLQVIGKIARVAAGDPLHLDNYIDGAAYLAIAGEAVQRLEPSDAPIRSGQQ